MPTAPPSVNTSPSALPPRSGRTQIVAAPVSAGLAYAGEGALSWRQRRLYQHRATIWRFTQAVDGSGKPAAKGWSVLAVSVPCYWETGQSQHGPDGGVLAEADNLFTLDKVHMPADVDAGSGDVLYCQQGPEVGEWFEVRGGPQKRTLHAEKLTVLTSRLERPPAGVS